MSGTQPLRDCSSDELVDAVERNWRAGVGAFGLAPTTVVRDDPELFWYVTGLPEAAFNSVMYANLAPDRIDAAVAELRALRAEHGVPINWLIGPTSRPLDLADQLVARGFRHLIDLTALAARLEDVHADEAPPAGVVVEPVADAAVYEEWIAAERRGFEMAGELADRFGDLRRGMGLGRRPGLHHFVGRLDGEPVGTATLLLAAGIAGIYDVSVAPEARRRGIGRALTLAALDAARRQGYAWAFLNASKMGEALYRRIGFGDCYVCSIYG
jgi:ribosomal protein S18 acetylase RimI-like enzyme